MHSEGVGAVLADVLVGDGVVGASNEGRHVGGEALGTRESPASNTVRHLLWFWSCGVRDHGPMGRCSDGELEVNLEVGLLKARVHPSGVGRFKLRVEIGLGVDGVDEAVQALAGIHVPRVGFDQQFVVGLEIVNDEPSSIERRGHVEFAAVEHCSIDSLSDDIDPRGRAGLVTFETQA